MMQIQQQAVPPFSILVVDDDQSILDFVTASLGEAGISNVIPVIDSSQVAKLMSRQDAGLILLDLSMPNMSGEEIMRTCRESHPDAAVIIISGNKDIDRAVSCMKSGAFDYLSKPLNPALLVSAVRRVIGEREKTRENLRRGESLFSPEYAGPPAGETVLPCRLPTIRNMIDLLIKEALRRSEGHQAHAAHALGISPQALSKRLKGGKKTKSEDSFSCDAGRADE